MGALKKCVLVTTGCLAISFCQVSFAQDNDNCVISGSGTEIDTGTQCLSNTDFFGKLDLSVPENALFSLMGSSPENVIKPKVGEKISLSFLPQSISSLNQDQFSLGTEVNIGAWMMPKHYTMDEFIGKRSNSVKSNRRVDKIESAKFWSRVTLAGAATKSSDGQKIEKYGLGVNYVNDSGSPLNAQLQYGDCIDNSEITLALNKLQEERAIMIATGQDTAEIVTKIDKLKTEKFLPFKKRCLHLVKPWNRDVRAFGLAVYQSEVSEPDPMAMSTVPAGSDTGFGAWGTIAKKLGDNGQLTLSGRYNDDLVRERKENDQTLTESVDGWRLGGRYTHHMSGVKKGNDGRAVRGFVEAAYAEEDFGLVKDKFTQAGVGVEVQLQDNLFFQAIIGDTFGSEIDRSTYLSGQFKWAFSSTAAE